MIRRAALGLVVVLGLLSLAACEGQWKVTANTNPTGNTAITCWLTIVNSESGDEQRLQKAAATCKACPVGAVYPDCMKESTGDVENREPEPVTPTRGGQGVEPGIINLRFVGGSTIAGFDMRIVYVGKDRRERSPVTHHEPTNEKELTSPGITNDRSVSFTVEADNASADVHCFIYTASRAEWASESGTGRVTCFTTIAERL